MSVNTSDLTSVTQAVWSTVLGHELDVDNSAGFHLMRPTPTLASVVQISGAWNGAVIVHCTTSLARRATEIMLGIAEGAASAEDIADALGEIANMIGGNIKSLVLEPSHLSLPAVSEGTDYGVTIPESQPVCERGFSDGREFLMVLVRERTDPDAIEVNG